VWNAAARGMGGSHGGQRSTRCPKNDGVLKEQFVTAVTSAEAEAWHAARAVDTEASMRLSRNCRSGQALSTGLPAPSCPPHDRLLGGAGPLCGEQPLGCPEGLLLFGAVQRGRIRAAMACGCPKNAGGLCDVPHTLAWNNRASTRHAGCEMGCTQLMT